MHSIKILIYLKKKEWFRTETILIVMALFCPLLIPEQNNSIT
jgi:hypothetical protein